MTDFEHPNRPLERPVEDIAPTRRGRTRRAVLASSAAIGGAFMVGCTTTPAAQTPAARTPAARTPAARTPAARTSAAADSPPTNAFESALKDVVPHALPTPPAGFASRVSRARVLLQEQGASALVITPSSNLRYYTGVSWWLSERFLAWVLPREGPPVFIVPAFERSRLEERIALSTAADGDAPAKIMTWREQDDPFSLIKTALAGGAGPVVVDPQAPFSFVAGIQGAIGRERVREGSAVTSSQRMRKDAEEVACLRAANGITLAALRLVFKHLDAGLASDEIGARVKRAQVVFGGERPWALSLVGPAAAFPHGTKTPGILTPGTGVLVDTGIAVHGYQSDLSRTVVFGEPTAGGKAVQDHAELLRAHRLVAEAQQRALAAVAPGVAARDVDNVARSYLTANGYGPEDRFFTHRLGHGIGLDGHEAPYLVGSNSAALDVGMTASCEPGVYVEGRFGVRLEDIFVVTPTGAQTLGPRQQGPWAADV